MSSKVDTPVKKEGRMPGWDEREQYFSTRTWVKLLIGLIVVVWLILLGWVFFIAPITKADVRPLEAGVDLTIVLAPVLAAAAGVERMLETIFNIIEGSWRTLVAYLGYGMRWLKSAEAEVAQARQWMSNTASVYNGTLADFNQKMNSLLGEAGTSGGVVSGIADLPAEFQSKMDALVKEAGEKTDAAKALLVDAQARLAEAESKLAGVTSSPNYKSAKGAVTIILGLMLGEIIAAMGSLQMFAMLGVSAVPARIDVFVTGLVIGSGSYPVHSLVGILQQGKDALDSVKGYFNRAGQPANSGE